LNKTTILTDKQIKQLVKAAPLVFGPDMCDQMKSFGVNFEEVIRLSSLGAKCQEAREGLGLTIKKVAVQLRVPQYRLKSIEERHGTEILPNVLEKYIKLLKIEKWFQKWAEANPKMAEKLGVNINEDS